MFISLVRLRYIEPVAGIRADGDRVIAVINCDSWLDGVDNGRIRFPHNLVIGITTCRLL